MPNMFRLTKLGAGFVFLALLLQSVEAGAVGRVDRKGVYSLGGWFQYGLIEGESRYGLDFNRGPGYGLHFRYNMSRKTALVFHFDSQSYDAEPDSLLDQLKLTNAHAGLRFFSIPQGDVLRYVELTAGFYRPEIRFHKTQQSSIGEEFAFPGEGFLVHAGAGIEIFFTGSWAVELGAHGYGLMGKGLFRGEEPMGEKNFSVAGQLAIGIDYYLLR
jgi:hypothetical protein